MLVSGAEDIDALVRFAAMLKSWPLVRVLTQFRFDPRSKPGRQPSECRQFIDGQEASRHH